MIDPKRQWAIQIEVTNACNRQCANCTRLVGHGAPFFMPVEDVRHAAACLASFPKESPPASHCPNKVIGVLGGEPMIHPDFAAICEAMEEAIPDRADRGLWTGLHWRNTRHASLIDRVFGYVNNNTHEGKVLHSPVLVAIRDVVKDEKRMWSLIDDCWLQRRWSSSITPKGFFFCEVAAAMDMVMGGPGGLPVEPRCWERPIEDFRELIERWCPRCGIALRLPPREDRDMVDDMSETNLATLKDSPRVRAGKYMLFDFRSKEINKTPWKYMR